MKKLYSIKTTAIALLGALAITGQASANSDDNNINQYLGSVVSTHMADTQYQLNNQIQQSVANLSHNFRLEQPEQNELLASVSVTFLDANSLSAKKPDSAE